jgi:hypothetical protein
VVALEIVERRLRAALEKARTNGLKIRRGTWGIVIDDFGEWTSDGAGCCALGAWAIEEQPELPDDDILAADPDLAIGVAVSAAFGWGSGLMRAFVSGFDGKSIDVDDKLLTPELAAVYALGARLAAEFAT